MSKLSFIIPLLAIGCITGLTFYGLSKGCDGTTLLTSVISIGGLAGFNVYRNALKG